jgi:small neutral amino acid transporter SnatA (MarC family)
MGLNLVTLWSTDAILKRISPGLLYLVGWVLAVLQAMLAVQIVIHGLRVLEVLRWPASPA